MKFVILIALLAIPAPLAACLGLQMQKFTFFTRPPSVLRQESVVARVRIIQDAQALSPMKIGATNQGFSLIDADVRIPEASIPVEVIENFRGSEVGDRFSVVLFPFSCSGIEHIKVGTEWYIAGKLNGDRFSGTWSYGKIAQDF